MLNPEQLQQQAAERADVRAFFADASRAALVLDRHAGCCDCGLLFPTWLEVWALWCRIFTMGAVNHLPSSWLRIRLYRWFGVTIGRGVYISAGVFLDPFFPRLIAIGDGAFLGLGARVLTHEYTVAQFRVGRVTIGAGSVVGAWATIRSGVRLGQRVNVGMCSLVLRDVPDGATVGGVPARDLHPPKDAKA